MQSEVSALGFLGFMLFACTNPAPAGTTTNANEGDTKSTAESLGTNTFGAIDVMSCPGVVGDGYTDDWAAIQACINTNPSRHIVFPKRQPGTSANSLPDYALSHTIHLCGGDQWLDGVTGGGNSGTILKFALDSGGQGITGIDLVQDNTTDPCASGIGTCRCLAPVPPIYSHISNLNITSETPPERCNEDPEDSCFLVNAGLRLRASFAVVSDVYVSNFAGHGVAIDGAAPSAADHVKLTNVTSVGNRGNGFFASGGDAQVAIVLGCDARTNEMWGFYEDSFLGNTYVMPHTAGNRLGPYYAMKPAAINIFINPYSEVGHPPARIGDTNMVIGGDAGAGYDWSLTPNVYSAGKMTSTVFLNHNATTGAESPIQLVTGGYQHEGNGAFYTINTAAPSNQSFLSFRRTTTGTDGWWGFGVYGHTPDTPQYSFPGYYGLLVPDAYTADAELRPWFPQGLYLGYDGVSSVRRKIVVGGQVPTSGTWNVGDIVLNWAPSTSVGWIKTASDWSAFGPIGESASSAVSTTATVTASIPGAFDSPWTALTWTPDKPLTVTRVEAQVRTSPTGCGTNANIRVSNGTTQVNIPIAANANDSGAVSQAFAAGTPITIALEQAAVGCSSMPANGNVVVQYRMQQ